METLESLLYGFQVAFTPENLIFVLIGVLAGTVIGMLPGLGPISAIAIMIPMSYGMSPASALIMMAGVYYGAIFGGSTSSILLNAPGVAGTVATSFDGYPMAQQGKAGKALAIAAICSFIGGTVGVVALILVAPGLAQVAVSFGPPEYFALMLLGLTAIASLADGSTIKAFIAAVVGLMLATIGIDQQTGTQRFTFGTPELMEGIDFLIIALGVFALAEVGFMIINRKESLFSSWKEVGSLKLTKQDIKELAGPTGRQSIMGFFLGVLPGAGATIASFLAYITEKRIAKDPSQFGKGSVKGVAAPETANNAACTGSFVPLLTLGIPGSGTTAVLLGALLVYGIQPGPLMMNEHPDIFWGVITSMYVGNMILLILNLPLIPYIARALLIPRPLLISLVILFCMIGVYGVSFATFDLYLLIIFGVVGFLMRRFRFPAAPLILAFILGSMMEQSLRQSLTLSGGDWGIFLERPITLLLLGFTALSLIWPLLKQWIAARKRNGNVAA
ncbi:tripartite tricarboxylate transporter permease [Desmospora activa]|uniref:Putative tricarboxylic transport membrane protein n=1 Tax=Desmospora activa DSM 45169 TaxID=1121389 RepID=A0A2T4ZCZ9_9BACL|nr:tripartite tricarboxylate transporter permease [Desmospora activa]PTM59756.1 putative tricarboxylic transport membrane protein [Desmospora activa DSM 45169]